MPEFVATVEVWFTADSLRDAERIADDFGDVIGDNAVEGITAITSGVAPAKAS